jgi:hypothetical protein
MHFIIPMLCGTFLVQPPFAAGDTEIILQKQFTTVTPTFMSGHEGDRRGLKAMASREPSCWVDEPLKRYQARPI